jgi:hypothetical protein
MEPTAPDPRTIYWAEDIQRVASDWDALRELGKQIASLAASPGWAALERLVRMKVDRLHADVLPPEVHAHSTYIALTNQEFSFHRLLELPDAVQLVVQREEELQRKAAERAARTRST